MVEKPNSMLSIISDPGISYSDESVRTKRQREEAAMRGNRNGNENRKKLMKSESRRDFLIIFSKFSADVGTRCRDAATQGPLLCIVLNLFSYEPGLLPG